LTVAYVFVFWKVVFLVVPTTDPYCQSLFIHLFTYCFWSFVYLFAFIIGAGSWTGQWRGHL